MSESVGILSYEKRRICGRVVISGCGEQTEITVRQNWRLASILLVLSVVFAVSGWAMQATQRAHLAWAILGMLLGYIAAIVLFSNAVGQAARRQRVRLTAKRMTVYRRGSETSFLRDEIISVGTGSFRAPLGYCVPSVNVAFRSGAALAVILASREETSFAAEALREAMHLAPDPLNLGRLHEISGRYVAVRVAACGAIGELRRRPSIVEGPIVSCAIGAMGTGLTISLVGISIAVCTASLLWISFGYGLWREFLRFSPFLSGGVWDNELVFTERCWMRRLASLRYGASDVADVGLKPASVAGRSYLRIVLKTGAEVLSEGAWLTPRMQALADTINESRRLCSASAADPESVSRTAGS